MKRPSRPSDSHPTPDLAKFYASARWKRFSLWCLADEPICRYCLKRGIVTSATESHHIKKARDFPELRFDRDNIASACHPCHKRLD